MITLELVSKKRKPAKRYAIYAIIAGVTLLVIVGITGGMADERIRKTMMLIAAIIFIVSLFVLSYSINFKNTIGRITFSEDQIITEILEKSEIFRLDGISSVRLKLAGFEGANNSTIFENLMWFPSLFAYHSGINNFVYINTASGTRKFEFHIPNKSAWRIMRNIARQYHERFRRR